MNLHPDAKKAVRKKIWSILEITYVIRRQNPLPNEYAEINNESKEIVVDYSVNWYAVFDKIKSVFESFSKADRDTFKGLLGTIGILYTIEDVLKSKFQEYKWNLEDDKLTLISQAIRREKFADLVESIVEEVLSYPHHYEIFVRLPRIKYDREIISMGEYVKIIQGTSRELTNYPKPSMDELPPPFLLWQDEYSYLSAIVSGYDNSFGGSNFQTLVEDKIYSSLGLLLALGVLSVGSENYNNTLFESILGSARMLKVPTYDLNSKDGISFNRIINLPTTATAFIERLEPQLNFHDKFLTVESIFDFNWFLDEHGTIAKEILSAARWYFNSLIEPNHTQSYIQASVGLEILLGQPNQHQNIVERLADRYAYLVGTSRLTRDKLRHHFISLYKTRSRIIHGGKIVLPASESGQLKFIQVALQNVLDIEASKFVDIRLTTQKK